MEHHSVRSGHKALRRGRCSISGQPYLVTTVTWDRRPFFRDWRVGRGVVAEIGRCHERGETESLAWVLMPDHLHWLFSLGDGSTLPAVMKSFKGRSARVVNERLGRTGSVWGAAYHDHALRRDEDLVAVARYIVANPLRAGLVEHIGDYPLWDAAWL